MATIEIDDIIDDEVEQETLSQVHPLAVTPSQKKLIRDCYEALGAKKAATLARRVILRGLAEAVKKKQAKKSS